MQIEPTAKILRKYADIYEQAEMETAGSDATWHIPVLEAWPLIQKLTKALRQIEHNTRIGAEVDPDYEEICETVNEIAEEALY